MATKASDQITIIDLTDGYTVSLSMDAIALNGGTSTLGTQQQVVVNVSAYRGGEKITPTVGTPTCPSNVTASVGSASSMVVPVTITFAAALNAAGQVSIPVTVDEVTITKMFSFGISFKGTSVTVSKTEYQAGASNTSAPTGTWSTSPVSVPQGQYLWTKVTYSDGSYAYSVARQGANGTNGTNGTSVTVTGTEYAYQLSTSGTTVPTGSWSESPVAPTTTQYAWTRTTTTYSDGSTAVTYTVGGKTGTNGANATAYHLIVSHAAINKSESGAYNPTSITLTGKSQTGTAAPANYSGRFKIETTTDNSTWTATYTSSANEATKTYTIPAGIVAVRCSLYLAGGTTTLLDQQTIPVVLDGAAGEDAISIAIISSGGTIFKNTSIATTLTAHIYKAGVEVTAAQAGGTLKWYKDGGSTAVATGATLTISAGDVTNKASYEVRLES